MTEQNTLAQRIERLNKMAMDALSQYHDEIAGGGEPEYPTWADDALAACGVAHIAMGDATVAESAQMVAKSSTPTDDEIEALAIKHIAPHGHRLREILPSAPTYQQTEQFRRVKAFTLELLASQATAAIHE